MLNQYLNKIERKFRKFAISNLMLYIVLGMAVVWIADLILSANPNNTVNLYQLLCFDRDKILQGEVWRVISFIFMPPSTILIILTPIILYFYWFMGSSLESQWGAFKFNVFYFTGIIGCIAAGFIIGFATNEYLNLSLFLAFAILFPNAQLLAFYVIPIKAKWLALIDGIIIIYDFIKGSFDIRIFIILSIINIIIFFGKDFFSMMYYLIRRLKYRHIKKIK
ncbi:hypothetical protein [Ruminococcus flavefaciens]|uniref:hypothetical protein n=2 Tax=Ruminococcus flavefaciens TaxID=1265 RepID=UPI0026F0EFFD|nr:hypothetical protein [Ruminococcus flavefaciens]